MSKNQLSIRLHGKQVGILEQLFNGNMAFTYDADATIPIAINMPIRPDIYHQQICEAFFGGLLPESPVAKKIIANKYHISPHNTFTMLRAIGYDCAGAISCHLLDDPMLEHASFTLAGRIISNDELYQHIQNLPFKPLFMDVEGLRLSLAGVQDKAAVCMVDENIFIPDNGCPTTHILKPESLHYKGLVANEYYCLTLAKKLNLPVPNVKLKQIRDISYLLVERYDRSIQNDCIQRVHQTDFCQALGIATHKKYQHDGGPNFSDCFNLLKQSQQPAIDRNTLTAGLVFNYLIGNMDAHSKNFSLLQSPNGDFKLAPFYDMVCTRAYSDLTNKMAMKIGSKYEADDIYPRHWKQLAENIDYSYPALVKLIIKMSMELRSLLPFYEDIPELHSYHGHLKLLSHMIDKNITITLDRFEKNKE